MPKLGNETLFPKKSAIRVLEDLLEDAYEARASDIHIEPIDECIRIRLRIDGILVPHDPLPRAVHAELLARIKILAGLRTDEHRRPQDGRFRHQLRSGDQLDLRVALTPAYFGEGYATEYTIAQNASTSRITVCAPLHAEQALPGSAPFCLTR